MTAFVRDIDPLPAPCRPTLESAGLPIPILVNSDNEKVLPIDAYFKEQYTIKDLVYVKPGDYVIDGGAYIGDTSIYFSQLAGNTGKVFAFEANTKVADVLKSNIKKIQSKIYMFSTRGCLMSRLSLL